MEYLLGELFELRMGKTPDRHNDLYWKEGSNRWISIADLGKCQKYIYDTKEKITDKAVKESGIKIIPQNTVIMSFKLSLGKLAITSEPIYSNEAIMAFLDKHVADISSDYLYYLLMNMRWEDNSNKAVMGKTLNKATISGVKVKIHDKLEQEKIVNILDKICCIIQQRKNQLQQLDRLVKSRFTEMFGDISREEYKYKTRKLGDVANVGSSHRVFTNEFVEHGIPFYRGTEIGELANHQTPANPYYISKEHYARLISNGTKPKIGDLLLPSICNKGQVWMVDTNAPFYYKDGRVLCVSADRGLYNTKYLQYYMKMKTEIEYPKLGSGSTFAEFKLFLLKDFDILTPPQSVQNQFSDFVEKTDKLKLHIDFSSKINFIMKT